MSIPKSQPTSLYLYFDACNTLLYVGITGKGDDRQRQHATQSAWWPLVRSSRVLHYPSRAEAVASEREAIKRWKPAFNRDQNPDAWGSMIRYFLERMPPTEANHEHLVGEKYGRCQNCNRCAVVYDDYAEDEGPRCDGCAAIEDATFEDAEKYGRRHGYAEGWHAGQYAIINPCLPGVDAQLAVTAPQLPQVSSPWDEVPA